MTPELFSAAILSWFQVHGRKTLPWQQQPTPYRVWVSEIMLQQTRVNTVIDYYQRFMQRFASIEQLAQAPLDEVLHLWAGLGYYSRARNLHKTAQIICQQYDGEFPRCPTRLAALPGIGRSTAGAIASLGMQLRAPILDGNVKRVLVRYSAEEEHTATTAAAKRLWTLAEQLTPTQGFAHYNQAMMDMGAALCTRSRPQCDSCPIQTGCKAFAQNRQHLLPKPRSKKNLPHKHTNMLLLINPQQQILLYQRPPQGLWGGLFSLPELDDKNQLNSFLLPLGLTGWSQQSLSPVKHVFSHFQLDIQPWLIQVTAQQPHTGEPGWLWYDSKQPQRIGLAAPVKKLIQQVAKQH